MCLIGVHITSFRLAGPLALIMAEVTALVDYDVRAASAFATAALSVAHWAVLHQLQDGLLVNNVLQRWSVMGQRRELRNDNDTWSTTRGGNIHKSSVWIHCCRCNSGKRGLTCITVTK